MIRLAIFDLDGTLWRGDEAIVGAAEAVNELRSRGIAVRFMTNNSAATVEWVSTKLDRMGFIARSEEIVAVGAFAGRLCLERNYKSAFVVGEAPLHEMFAAFAAPGLDADVVVAGIDRDFTYAKCNAALQYIRRGAHFLATNRDATYPVENGVLQPGAGAIVAAIEAASGVSPEIVGKPSPAMIYALLDGIKPEDCLVVGDRLDTDIAAGTNAGCQTCLVLTGATLDPVPGLRTVISVADLPRTLGNDE